MFCVISETGISLSSIADPKSTIQGRLLSLDGRYAEASFDTAAPLTRGTLVQFQTSDTLYLGEIETGWKEADANRVRVLIEHSVDLERAAVIRRLWNTDGCT
jgi:hypothetical protein